MRFRREEVRKKKEHEYELIEKAGLESEQHLHQDYEYASGIVERAGFVPLWLKVVYVSLTIWAIYYIFRYWSG